MAVGSARPFGLVVGAVWLVAACGSGGSAGGTAAPDDSRATTIIDGAGDDATGSNTLRAGESNELAELAVAQFASDDSAIDVLLRAINRGYTGDQIIAALRSGTLAEDGSIDGAEPDGAEQGLVVAFRRTATPPQPLPIERFRAAAIAAADKLDPRFDVRSPVGVAGTRLILWILDTYGHELVLEALYFGFEIRSLSPEECLDQVAYENCGTQRCNPILWIGGTDTYRPLTCGSESTTDGEDAAGPSVAAGSDPASPTSTSTTPTPTMAPNAELPTSWEGPITFDPNAGTLVDSHVAIDRAADGSFTLNAFVEFTREAPGCFWTELQTAEGTGELVADGSSIHFEGTFTSDIESSGGDCAAGSESVETTYDVAIDGGTLSGSIFAYTEFELTP